MPMLRSFAVAALIIGGACSGGSTGYSPPPPPNPPAVPPPPPPPLPPPPPPPPPEGHSTTITVDNNFFSPTPDTIHVGTITFSWAAAAGTHNVTWTGGPTTPTSSGNKVGGSADYTAPLSAGTYTYHCTLHSAFGMSGEIVVLP